MNDHFITPDSESTNNFERFKKYNSMKLKLH